MGGNGDCFFRSIIKAENHWNNVQETEDQVQKAAMKLRLEAVKHIRKRKDMYAAAWSNDDMEAQYHRAGQGPPANFEAFLELSKQKDLLGE